MANFRRNLSGDDELKVGGKEMELSARSKPALIAYCALAQRLSTPGMGIMQALTPFLAEACKKFTGDLFDAAKFSDAVAERYGLRIPRLAALGLAEQLANAGLLVAVSTHTRATVYRYANVLAPAEDPAASPVTESEVELVLASFVQFCRTDDRLKDIDDASLHSAFLERLLHTDSMRILGRREASIAAKKTTETLVLPKTVNGGAQPDRAELHLDYLVSQFLLDLRDRNSAAFERVSDIAFANMAAEAITCFREPESPGSSLSSLTVYLDSPLLLDMLGVNSEYAEYGRELLDAILASGAKAAIFDHCVAEAEATIHAQLSHLRSGINQLSAHWGTTAKPDLLAALSGNVGQRSEERLRIKVERDPEVNLHRRSPNTVGDIDAEMNVRMHAWRNEDAKEYDRKSVWAMLAIRKTTEPCPRICDSKFLLLTRNTALVGIANKSWTTWLKGSTNHSQMHIDRWAPVAMSDKQFAGYLWARSGGSDGAISQARLLAHCSAAVRPRADVKARAYNMILELSGRQEADDVAALLEDREGARALMRATKGDPEDVTRERLPFILEKVKLAAGEFAAARVREESDRELEEAEFAHKKEVERLRKEADAVRAAHHADTRAAQDVLLQLQQDQQRIEEKNAALQGSLSEQAAAEKSRKDRILRDGLNAGADFYNFLRWAIAALFGIALGYTALFAVDEPIMAAGVTVLLGVLGFWFVPDVCDGPLNWCAKKRLKESIATKDANLEIPTQNPDFRGRTWVALVDPGSVSGERAN